MARGAGSRRLIGEKALCYRGGVPPQIDAVVRSEEGRLKQDLRWPAYVFVLALALRLAFVLDVTAGPLGRGLSLDSVAADRWALSIAGGDWVGDEVFFQAPLYPYCLGLFYRLVGRDFFAVRIVQAVGGALNCLLLYAVARRLAGRTAAVLTGLGAALYAPCIFFDAMVLKTSLGVLLLNAALLAAVWAWEDRKAWRWLAVGLLCGAAALVRENALVAAGLLAVAAAARRRPGRLRCGAAVAAGVAVAVLPVTVRNACVGRDLVLITCQGGQNFYIGNDPVRGRGTYLAQDGVGGNPESERRGYARAASAAVGRKLAPSEVSRYYYRKSFERLAEHPWSSAVLFARKVGAFWSAYEIPDNYSIRVAAAFSPLLGWGVLLGFGAVAPLGLAGAVLLRRQWRRVLPVYVVAAATFVTVAAFFVFGRYRLSVTGPLLVLAGAGTAQLAARLRARDRGALALFAGVAVAAALLVNAGRLAGRGEPKGYTFLAWYNLGNASRRAGEWDDAVAAYRKALAARPGHPSALNNLGLALRRAGRRAGAETAYLRALAEHPGMVAASLNLGKLYLEDERYEEAIEVFRSLVARHPDDARPRRGLAAARAGRDVLKGSGGEARHLARGTALLEAGLFREAEAALRRAVAVDARSAAAWKYLGLARAVGGDARGGVEAMARAAVLTPDDGELHFFLAKVYAEGLGDMPRARAALKRAEACGFRVPAWLRKRISGEADKQA
jgi:tetratricopeptide (TPR) repeat protein